MGPSCDDGYTKIANELLEALCRTRISGESMQIFLVILRKTYGYGKKIDRISLSQFVQYSGMKKPAVIRALRNLHGMGFIIKEDNGTSASYGINKYHGTWEPLSKRITTFQPLSLLKNFCYICNYDKTTEKHYIIPRSEGGANKSSNLIVLCPNCRARVQKEEFSRDALIIKKANVESVIKDDNVILSKKIKTGGKPLSKTVPTKANTPIKETTTKETKALLPICAAWKAFKEMRKRIKKPLTEYAEGLIIKKLIDFQAKGHDPTEVLNLAIENSWQGVYEPKEKPNGTRSGVVGGSKAAGRKAGIVEANSPDTDWLGDGG